LLPNFQHLKHDADSIKSQDNVQIGYKHIDDCGQSVRSYTATEVFETQALLTNCNTNVYIVLPFVHIRTLSFGIGVRFSERLKIICIFCQVFLKFVNMLKRYSSLHTFTYTGCARRPSARDERIVPVQGRIGVCETSMHCHGRDLKLERLRSTTPN